MNILYVSAGTGENPWITEAGTAYQGETSSLRVIQATSEALDSEEKTFVLTLEEMKNCQFLIVSNHGSATYFKKFDRLVAAARKQEIPAFICSSITEEMNDFRSLFPFPDEEYDYIHAVIELGGIENTTSLLLCISKCLGVPGIELPPIRYPPTEGCYHPSLPGIHDFDIHAARLDPEKHTVGILLHQLFYVRKNLHAIDALIAAIEAEGMNALPFFLVTSPNPVTGALGIRKFVDQHLIKDGRPVIDVLIITMSFSQLSLSDPNDGTKTEPVYNFFNDLDVPILQTITLYRTFETWQNDEAGLSPMEISSGVIWPEFDGQIIAIPLGTTGERDGRNNLSIPIPGRPERIAVMARRWAELRKTPPAERKVAILLYQYTGDMDALGDAGGLDTPKSVVDILHRLKDEGYVVGQIPKTGNDLIGAMIAGLTNDTRYLSEEEMHRRSAALVPEERYREWFTTIPGRNQEKIAKDWGPVPGEVMTARGDLCIPGLVLGNIFIGIQPPRGLFEKVESLIHSNDMVMPHQYLAYYRWIRDVFGARVIIHMGTHGTLEWLPGKGNALSEECYPDVILEDMPHLYPYIMNDPGEGIQAKRRSWAVLLDHLVPAMMRAEGYGELTDLDSILQEYLRAVRGGETQKADELISEVAGIVREQNLTHDLGLDENASVPEIAARAEQIYDYLCEVRDVIIKDGLHIFGQPPVDERFREMIYAQTRLENGPIPSLREGVARSLDLTIQDLLDTPSGYNEQYHRMNGELLDVIDARCQDLIIMMDSCGYDREDVLSRIKDESGEINRTLEASVTGICDDIVHRVRQTTDEMTNLVRGLNAGYIPPGPCGDPTRGNVHLLPTGRNCYSIDPASIPTPAAWQTGKAMADQMIERYIEEKGEYPERVGIVVWATDTMRTGGDDIAYILWLMGLKPIWSDRGGAVTGLEVISPQELNRPRIDVTLRISGLFRDSFPNLVHLIDEGVGIIASLDEADDVNFLSAHLKEDLVEKIREGFSEEEARDQALIRIFGDPPGNHGCAVGEAVHTSAWKDRRDLADIYTTWGAHAYGRKFKGEKFPELFRDRFGQLDATVKNRVSHEWDILDVDDDYIFLGGMNACVKAYGNKDPVSIIGEACDPKNVKTRLLEEEVRFIFRSRVLNPRWIEGLKPHGFRGVQEITNTFEYTFGWDVTSDAVDDWEYQAAAEHFLFNEETASGLKRTIHMPCTASPAGFLRPMSGDSGRPTRRPSADSRRYTLNLKNFLNKPGRILPIHDFTMTAEHTGRYLHHDHN